MVPDMILEDLDPADSNLLILPGADMWDAGGGTAFAAAAARYLDAGVPVAAICGAIRRISFVAHPFSNRIGAQLATDELRNTLTTMRHLVALLEADQLPPND
jgi:hypothetical protein